MCGRAQGAQAHGEAAPKVAAARLLASSPVFQRGRTLLQLPAGAALLVDGRTAATWDRQVRELVSSRVKGVGHKQVGCRALYVLSGVVLVFKSMGWHLTKVLPLHVHIAYSCKGFTKAQVCCRHSLEHTPLAILHA